jgi:hypothetical protein
VKRDELVRRIGNAAKAAGTEWHMVRHSGSHEVWSCGGVLVAIPRHREIAEGTAEDVMKRVEQALGERWWRR